MRKGFTLIELLIVVSIIGILAVVLIPNVSDAPSRARDADRISTVNEIVAAVEAFYIDNNRYPVGIMCVGPVSPVFPEALGVPFTSESADETDFVNNYLGGSAPSNPSIYEKPVYCDDGTNAYHIYVSTNPSEYFVGVLIENSGQASEELPFDDTTDTAPFYRVNR